MSPISSIRVRPMWLAAMLACVVPALCLAAEPTSQPTTAPAVDVPADVAAAKTWLSKPAQEEVLHLFDDAVELRYREYTDPKPQHIWIARVDLTKPGVRCVPTEPAQFTGEDAGKFETRSETTLAFAQRTGAQLAINTSAFGPLRAKPGEPMDISGLAAFEGRVYSKQQQQLGAMYISREGRITLKAPPLDEEGVWHVIPGFRMLVDDGAIALTPKEAATRFAGVNPRTAVGVDQAGETLWIVSADGRLAGTSVGLTLAEMTAQFQLLGAWDALNLDGGGSTTLVVQQSDGTHRVLNTPGGPTAPGKLRQVAHNLGLSLPGRPPEPAAVAPLAPPPPTSQPAPAAAGD